MPDTMLQVVWRPEDAHDVFTRAATVAAIQAVSDEFPQTVGGSGVLADIIDREGM